VYVFLGPGLPRVEHAVHKNRDLGSLIPFPPREPGLILRYIKQEEEEEEEKEYDKEFEGGQRRRRRRRRTMSSSQVTTRFASSIVWSHLTAPISMPRGKLGPWEVDTLCCRATDTHRSRFCAFLSFNMSSKVLRPQKMLCTRGVKRKPTCLLVSFRDSRPTALMPATS